MVKAIQHQAAQSRRKTYPGTRKRSLKFIAGDYVFLKISSFKGIYDLVKKVKSGMGSLSHLECHEKWDPWLIEWP